VTGNESRVPGLPWNLFVSLAATTLLLPSNANICLFLDISLCVLLVLFYRREKAGVRDSFIK